MCTPTDLYAVLASNLIRVPFGHWTKDSDNIRNFFNNLAEKLDFDPLVASNWYNVDTNAIRSELVYYLFRS